jgi:surfactin synthase thioesterase subunit
MAQPNLDSWIAAHKPNPHASLRLFCFPYAGRGASIFRKWSEDLFPRIEVYPIQLPGRERRMREQAFTRLSPLVQTLARVLLTHLDKPFAFFGHSMGALISFELARLLRQEHNLEPNHLFVSAYPAPQLANPEPPVHALPVPAFMKELDRLDGTPSTVLEDAQLMELFIPILRADLAVCETYSYATAPPLDCPITAFGGLHDRRVSYDELKAWREQTRTLFSLRMFPGDHFFLNTARPLLLQAIVQELAQ